MKEEIWAFLFWAKSNRAAYLCRDTGYEEPYCFYGSEIEEMIDDYIKLQEEE